MNLIDADELLEWIERNKSHVIDDTPYNYSSYHVIDLDDLIKHILTMQENGIDVEFNGQLKFKRGGSADADLPTTIANLEEER